MSETAVLVLTDASGTVFLQNHLSTTRRYLQLLANGVMEVLPNRNFYVLVYKIGDRHTRLSKNTVVGDTHPATASILAVTDATYTQVNENIDITEKGGIKSKDKALDADSTSTVTISEEYEPQRKKIIQMLSEYADVWDEHLGIITAVKHRTDWEPDTQPFEQVPYASSQKLREWEKEEVAEMLE